MEASQHVTLSRPPISFHPPSAGRVKSSLAALQNIARVLPKSSNQAGAGAAAKGVKVAKTGKAARSRGFGCTPSGTSKAKSAAKGLAPATPVTRAKQGRKAEPKRAAAAGVSSNEQTAAGAGAETAIPQGGQDQQEVQGCGGKNTVMVIAPDLVQFLSPKKLASLSR